MMIIKEKIKRMWQDAFVDFKIKSLHLPGRKWSADYCSVSTTVVIW